MMDAPNAARAWLILTAVMILAGCRGDGETKLFSGFQPSAGQPPTISGSPIGKVAVGEVYSFQPTAEDPDGQPLKFSITNKPRWAAFDASSGLLRGAPSSDDVGTFSSIRISVSDGGSTNSIGPFSIVVAPSASTPGTPSSPTTPSTPPMEQPTPTPTPSAGSAFEFSEIPEIVFVRGYAETQNLGIFHLDTLNRWSPGDLENRSNWKPRISTQMDIVDGSITGVAYDPATAVLRYDGTGSGTETATVTLSAPGAGVVSQRFNVRVLAPTLVWGNGASKRFSTTGVDAETTPWMEMQKLLRRGAEYDEPNVLMITAGTYAGDFYIGSGKKNLYIIGEPGSRPVLRGGHLPISVVETAYLKNLELYETLVDGGQYYVDRAVNIYVTEIYQHDSTKSRNGFSTPAYEGDSRYGIVKPPGVWRHWFWNFHGSQMGGTGALNHQFYIQGRPNTYLIVNNMLITGSCECSVLKSTRYHNILRNSLISSVLDPENPTIGLRSDKLVDFVSAGEAIVYNNEFIGARSLAKGGLTAFVHFRARRNWWGADSPAYPDVSWDPPVTSNVDGGYLAPKGFSAGPETYVSQAFWNTVRSYDLKDASNPYTFKKFVAYNTFRWIDEGDRRAPAIREDGTAPRAAAYQFSNAEVWGTIPSNWVERSVVFVANNTYIGWDPTDVPANRFIDMVWTTPENLVTRVGPGPWAWPAPPRTLVSVGGENGPLGNTGPIELPAWFRK